MSIIIVIGSGAVMAGAVEILHTLNCKVKSNARRGRSYQCFN